MPDMAPLKAALRHLTILGALEVTDRSKIDALLSVKNVTGGIGGSNTLKSDPTRVTKLGSLLSKVPLSPKFAKMLVVASKYELAHLAIMMVACMSVAEIYQEVRADRAPQDDNALDEGDLDPDLITSIDKERSKGKRRRVE